MHPTSQSLKPLWVLNFALALLGFGFVVAVLTPQHFLPLPAFYQEVGMAVVAIAATLLLVAVGGLRDGWALPWSSIAAISIAAVMVIELRFSQAPYQDASIWPVGSLLTAAMAAWFGHTMARSSLADLLLRVLMSAFIVAGIGTAIVLWVQLVRPGEQTLWLFPRLPLQPPSGNIAQRNQAALILGFGLIGLTYWARFDSSYMHLKRLAAVLGGILLISATTLTQSRIAFGFLGIAGVAAGLLWVAPGRRIHSALIGLVVVGLMYLTLQWLIYTGFGLGQLFPPATRRLADRGIGQRIGMLRVAWAEWKAHPWLGGGFGSFSNWEYRLGLEQPQPLYSTNAHNLFAQIGAEFGLLGVAALLFPTLVSLAHMSAQLARNGIAKLEDWKIAALAICAMLAGYSLTEFPLWYEFFLIPLALCWGALDHTALHIRLSRTAASLLLLIPCVMLWFLGWASLRYFDIVKLTAFGQDVTFFRKHEVAYQKNLQKIINSPGFSPQIDALNFYSLSIDPFSLKQKIALGERVAGSYTAAFFIQKLALLYALNHNYKESAMAFSKECAFYPNECSAVRDIVSQLKTKDPSSFGPVAQIFFKSPQANVQFVNKNVLRPWEQGDKGTIVTIDSGKTLFGFNLARLAAGIQQYNGHFIAKPDK